MKRGIIIGGGIGGLTTAIALQKKGIDFTVFEQAPAITEVGAGIWVASNGLKVFNKLDLADQFIQSGHALKTINVIDTADKKLSMIDVEKVKSKHQFGTIAFHRAKLQKQLLDQLPAEKIITGKQFVKYDQGKNHVYAYFSDGTIAEGDFLIGADGIKSKTREQKIMPGMPLRYSGQTYWRFVTEFKLPEKNSHHMYEIWGKEKGLRAAYSGLENNLVYCYITTYSAPGKIIDKKDVKNYLLHLCKDFQPIIKEIIHSVPEENIIQTDLFDFKPIFNWMDERVALLGDAAHATTPNLGQGACQSIEDAYIIANELSLTDDVVQAFKNYQQKRIKKAHYITKASMIVGKTTNTSGFSKYIIKQLMRITPSFISNKQIDKMYNVME